MLLVLALIAASAVPTPTSNCDIGQINAEYSQQMAAAETKIRQLLSESRTLSEKRKFIAQRRVEISQMNPLRRALKAADRNYSITALDELDTALLSQQSAISQQARLIQADVSLAELHKQTVLKACGL